MEKTPMKKKLSIWLALPVLLLMSSGCAHKTQPLPSWALTPTEANLGETISAANRVVTGFESRQATCATDSSLPDCAAIPTVKPIIQDIQQALVIAQPLFNTWEQALKTNANTPAPAALTTQVNNITTALGRVPASMKK